MAEPLALNMKLPDCSPLELSLETLKKPQPPQWSEGETRDFGEHF